MARWLLGRGLRVRQSLRPVPIQSVAGSSFRRKFTILEAKQRQRGHLAQFSSLATEQIEPVVLNGRLLSPPNTRHIPFQVEGIKFLLEQKSAILADEMGLGKSAQALGVVNYDASIEKILIVCPKGLLYNWVAEIEKWQVGQRQVFCTKNASLDWSLLTGPCFVVINYEMASKYQEEIQGTKWDMLICDEAHMLKSPDAVRTKAVLGDLKKNREGQIHARYQLYLTGSPIINRPLELYGLINALKPKFMSLVEFEDKYCDPQYKFGRKIVTGASNLQDLQRYLWENNLMLRREKLDVLKDLPKKIRRKHCIVTAELQNIAKEELVALQELGGVQAGLPELALSRAIAAGPSLQEDDDDTETGAVVPNQTSPQQPEIDRIFDNVVGDLPVGIKQLLSSGKMTDRQSITKIRMDTAHKKVPETVRLLKENMKSNKYVVFCHHVSVMEAIFKEFSSEEAVLVHGQCSAEARAERINRFQNDDSVRVFIGGIKSAGYGINLTAAHNVVFVEFDWSPENMKQAEDRCHRIGQTKDVEIAYLVIPGTIDDYIITTIIRKQRVIDEILFADEASVGAMQAASPDLAELGPDPATSVQSVLERLSEANLHVNSAEQGFVREALQVAIDIIERQAEENLQLRQRVDHIQENIIDNNKTQPGGTQMVYTLKFGKYENRCISQVYDLDKEYFNWMKQNPSLMKKKPGLKKSIQKVEKMNRVGNSQQWTRQRAEAVAAAKK